MFDELKIPFIIFGVILISILIFVIIKFPPPPIEEELLKKECEQYKDLKIEEIPAKCIKVFMPFEDKIL